MKSMLFIQTGILIIIILLCFVSGVQAKTVETIIAEIEPSMFSPESEIALPGVFLITDGSQTTQPLCFPFNGIWEKIELGTIQSCPIDPLTNLPPPAMQQQMGPMPASGVNWVVGNLGLSTNQWLQDDSQSPENVRPFKSVRRAAHLGLGLKEDRVYWVFDSKKLPKELKSEIPDGGIWMHAQDVLPSQDVYPFTNSHQMLKIAAHLDLIGLEIDGDATTTMTVGIIMQAHNTQNQWIPITLLVSLFNSTGQYQEFIGSDGRNSFVGSSLMGNPQYIIPLTPNQSLTNYRMKDFIFGLNTITMTNIVTAMNVYLKQNNLPLLQTDLSQIRLHQVDIRNESRFLDKGDIRINLKMGAVKAFLVSDSGS
jgi:hypothetical protein